MLPQELVDTIVGLLDATDTHSLKACALVSPSLCCACQAVLFRSITLKGRKGDMYPSNYNAAGTLFTKSSHIGAYVRELKIELPLGLATREEAMAISQVLTNLTEVRRCVFEGGASTTWDKLGFGAAILDFLFRQPLKYFCIRAVTGIPLVAFMHLFASAPALSFSDVDVCGITDVSEALTDPPSVTELVLDRGTQWISDLLSTPEYALHTRELRRVSVRYGLGLPLLIATAPTLYHIRVGSPAMTTDDCSQSLPPLPSLRSFEIESAFKARTAPWVSDTINAILASRSISGTDEDAPRLEQLTITYRPAWDWTIPGGPYALFLEALDRQVTNHGPSLRLRWRLRFVGVGREDRFEMLRAFIELHMPQLNTMDRLSFETYEPNWRDEFL
ncbi:hypothetical protein B0H11DRAFT_2096546 [Mycena galericulata]|nr:hypothetical protein B0H11DRAFT_2096546 [Mycena galericulata]